MHNDLLFLTGGNFGCGQLSSDCTEGNPHRKSSGADTVVQLSQCESSLDSHLLQLKIRMCVLVFLTSFFPHDANYYIFFAELKISHTSTNVMLVYSTIAYTPIEMVFGA